MTTATSPLPTAPTSLRLEHEELHGELKRATELLGRTARTARGLAHVMHAHFLREEEIATPPLGLLARLPHGRVAPEEAAAAITLADRLTAELPRMLQEHVAIGRALDALEEAAHAEGHPDVVAFAARLRLHARTEEEVLYPAAVLVGEYLKWRRTTT